VRTVLDVVSAVLLLGGASFTVLAAIGLQQFDDVFARMHAATKAITLGLVLVAVGAALQLESGGDVAKLLIAAALQLVTAPVAAHMVSRAAYRAGTELSPRTAVDELAGVLRKGELDDRQPADERDQD
jgi:multicomponent Na+:H+ antiporter subunit G